MNLCKKLTLFFKDKIVPNCSRKNKYFRFLIIILGFIFFYFTVSFNVENRSIWKDNNGFKDVSDIFKDNTKKIEQHQDKKIDNSEISEQSFINFKGMFIGIIIFVVLFVLKKGFNGISLGTLVGACIGIWISIGIPSIVYFLEFVFSGKIFFKN
ncbi:hypothetical protein CWO85_03210 [Candidatus Phytoplasma ziziphi]|uniref:Uncharacterized protein n=1 Tax=Ziziphus jujuba witches'-broom phytoplasma TaxID=135727 RepID=A0A660HNW4_ZIZJU|nr:hypothetical protein [Candidatus Phytoplasma ziziphi]AYJ01486.1 hypothetical protein CWO85_03210 [Candidatus Phytoplasma ziziphi]